MKKEEIIQKIRNAVGPCEIELNGSDCNFSVKVVAAVFDGKNTIQRHRMINDALKADIQNGTLHAVSISTATPEED